MKLKMLCDVDSGLPISDSLGNQRVCGILVDDGSFIVLFVDKVTSSLYIERVINKFAVNMFCSSNFEKITDEEFTEIKFLMNKTIKTGEQNLVDFISKFA